jgi:hypothetical protein
MFIGAEEYTVYKGEYSAENFFSWENCNLEIRYDDKIKMYYYFYQLPITNTPVWIALTDSSLNTLRSNLAKYIEWVNTAQREKTNITKELPDSSITTAGVIVDTGIGRKQCDENLVTLKFVFSNDIKNNTPLLFIISNKVYTRDGNNNITTIEIRNMQLTREQAHSLLNGIDQKNMANNLDKAKKAIDLFN